jgi:hypothetical protein
MWPIPYLHVWLGIALDFLVATGYRHYFDVSACIARLPEFALAFNGINQN